MIFKQEKMRGHLPERPGCYLKGITEKLLIIRILLREQFMPPVLIFWCG